MSRIPRREPVALGDLLFEILRGERLSAAIDTRQIYAAWDSVSGAGDYTVRKFFRSGRLYITVSSSVVRSQLLFCKDSLLESLNRELRENVLFSGDKGLCGYVKELIIK